MYRVRIDQVIQDESVGDTIRRLGYLDFDSRGSLIDFLRAGTGEDGDRDILSITRDRKAWIFVYDDYGDRCTYSYKAVYHPSGS